MGKIRKYFAGANTSVGFDNLFNNIKLKNKDGFHYILKGGAGSGKSTLMKRVADHFINKGETVEQFYCSSDSLSLDGINLTNHNITIVDGTAPHIVSDYFPLIKDKIINLGQFISPKVIQHKNEIMQLSDIKQSYFKSAYNKLKIAGDLFNLKLDSEKSCGADDFANTILENLNLTKLNNSQSIRKLYLKVLDFNNSNFEDENNFEIIPLKHNEKTNNEIIEILADKISKLGYSVILFKNILNPKLNSSLLIDEKNILIKNTENLCVKNKNNKLINSFLESAKKDLKNASSTHKKIEKIYFKHVNFNQISKLTEDLILEIEDRINKTI